MTRHSIHLFGKVLSGTLSLVLGSGSCSATGSIIPESREITASAHQVQVRKDLIAEAGVDKLILPGQTHSYRLRLETGQFLRVVVEQKGVDLAIELADPEGKTIFEMDSPNGPFGPEPMSLIVEKPGEYGLTVKADSGNLREGHYVVTTVQIRTATSTDALHARGSLLIADGNRLVGDGTAAGFRAAVAKYEEALPLFRGAGDKYLEAGCLYQLGYMTFALSEKEKPQEYFARAQVLAHEIGDVQDEASAITALGWVQDSLSQRSQALDLYFRALPLHRSVGNLWGEAGTLSSIAKSYELIGEHEKALDYYQQSLPIRRQSGDRDGEGVVLHGMGIIYSNTGQYQQALDRFNAALAIRKERNDIRGLTASYQVIGGIYAEMGEAATALDYFQQALALSRKTGNRMGEAYVLTSMSAISRSLGKDAEAIGYSQEALKVRRDIGDRDGQSASLNTLGLLALETKDYPKAQEYLEEGLKLSREVRARLTEVAILDNLGGVFLAQKVPQKASEYHRQALILAEQINDKRGQALSLMNLAKAERYRGDLVQARARIEDALKLMDEIRMNVGSATLRSSYLAGSQDHYSFYIDLLMQLYKAAPNPGLLAAAVEANESARARSLLEQLNEAHAEIREGADPALLRREKQLQEELNTKATEQIMLSSSASPSPKAKTIESEINSLTVQLDALRAEIRIKSPRYAALTQPQPLKLDAIQKLLDENSLLLEFALGEERSFLWAVSRSSITGFQLPPGREIANDARLLYEAFSRNGGAAGKTDSELASKVSQMLLGPVAAQLGEKRLLLVTDGILQYLPFGALPDPLARQEGKASQASLLISRHEIVSLPSASTIAILRNELKTRKAPDQELAILADPVFEKTDSRVKAQSPTVSNGPAAAPASSTPNLLLASSARDANLNHFDRLLATRREASEISAFAPPDKTFRALDFSASRSTAMSSTLARYRVVHFATHGILNAQHPDLSGLVLSLVDEHGQPQDGFLRAHEVYNLKLNANLVVLSGCQTALGKEVRGEGLIGLTRGFMYAGTPRVLSTVWKIPDRPTAELMKNFYRAMLVDKKGPAAALRAAQMQMLKDPQWSAPYYWAAFILQGEWR